MNLLRRVSQILIIVIFILLPMATAFDITLLTGSLFSLEFAKIPFADPVVAASLLSTSVFTASAIFLGAGLSLLIAFLLGRVFCSWICPYGFFSEIAFKLTSQFGTNASKNNSKVPYKNSPKHKKIFIFKLCLLIFILLCGLLFSFPLIQFFRLMHFTTARSNPRK